MREKFPRGMEAYLDLYGWHMGKGLYEWAVARMHGRNGSFAPIDKASAENMLKRYGIDVSKYTSYDWLYVLNMARADYWGSSITDEQHLAMFVRDYLEDPDGYDEVAMTRFYADCIGKGEMPDWEECI